MNVYHTFLPIFWASKLVGLAPLQLKRKPPHLIPQVGIITILRVIFVSVLFVFICMEMEIVDLQESITGIAMRIEIYLGFSLTLVCLIAAIINRKSMVSIMQHFTKLDIDMRRTGITIVYKNARICAFAQISLITTLLLLKGTIQVFSYNGMLLINYNMFNIIEFTNTLQLLQYVNILLLLRQRYTWLNQKIKDLKYKLFEMYKPAQKSLTPIVLGHYDPHLSVNYLIKRYGMLHNAMHDIALITNRTYGVQLFATILVRFIMITTQMIYTYKVVSDLEKDDFTIYFLLIVYISLHILNIFMVLVISESTEKKAKAAGVYLHELWDSAGETRELIHFFSQQIIHQNSHFHACGFFKLDSAFMSSIVGSITTYLIIIIQFDINSQNAACNND